MLFKSGEEKIWQSFDPGAEELQILKRGMRVNLVPRGESQSGKTQYSIVLMDPIPTASLEGDRVTSPMLSDAQKRDVAAYVEQMAKLYRYCFEQAQIALTGATENPATIQAAASTLFIAAQRKFGI